MASCRSRVLLALEEGRLPQPLQDSLGGRKVALLEAQLAQVFEGGPVLGVDRQGRVVVAFGGGEIRRVAPAGSDAHQVVPVRVAGGVDPLQLLHGLRPPPGQDQAAGLAQDVRGRRSGAGLPGAGERRHRGARRQDPAGEAKGAEMVSHGISFRRVGRAAAGRPNPRRRAQARAPGCGDVRPAPGGTGTARRCGPERRPSPRSPRNASSSEYKGQLGKDRRQYPIPSAAEVVEALEVIAAG